LVEGHHHWVEDHHHRPEEEEAVWTKIEKGGVEENDGVHDLVQYQDHDLYLGFVACV
jgi:hypothetical protein